MVPTRVPSVTLRVGEVTGVAAPRTLDWDLDDFSPGCGRGYECVIDPLACRDVEPQRHAVPHVGRDHVIFRGAASLPSRSMGQSASRTLPIVNDT